MERDWILHTLHAEMQCGSMRQRVGKANRMVHFRGIADIDAYTEDCLDTMFQLEHHKCPGGNTRPYAPAAPWV